jgi:hypothetical protein
MFSVEVAVLLALLSVTNVVSHHIIVTCEIYCHFVIGMLLPAGTGAIGRSKSAGLA